MTLAKFVIIITIALTTIAVALIVGAVLMAESERKQKVFNTSGLIQLPEDNRGKVEWLGAVKWVPVEERLPEENKRVLVTAEWDEDMKRVVETRRLPGDGKTRVWTIGYNGIVLAWAELPKPYEK